MGRAFGLFLLVVGIGLAAYGLPSAETNWPASTPAAGPASGKNSSGREPGETVVARTSPAANATATQVNGSFQAPMDKLRAAGQAARAIASGQEPEASHLPLSQNGKIDPPPVARAIELSPAARAVPPAPSVVTAARRETAAAAGATASASGWRTVVSQAPHAPSLNQSAAAARDGGSQQAGARAVVGTAPVRTTTVSISSGTSSGAPSIDSVTSAASGVNADPNPDLKPEAKSQWAAAEKPSARSQPETPARARLAQRYTPPVYLGRSQNSGSSSSGGSSGNGAPRRAFKSQDMWENNKRTGM